MNLFSISKAWLTRAHFDCIALRPEKNHPAQLRALRSLLQAHPEYRTGPDAVSLVLLGSVRSKDDMNRVDALKELAFELNVHVRLIFCSVRAAHHSDVRF